MRYKATLILLAGIVVFFFSSFSFGAKQLNKQIISRGDTVKTAFIQADSLDLSTLKFTSFKKKAHASYYADKFNGRRTASGSKFDNNQYTCAHRKFPFGTKLRITNEENGKFVIVEVTDRGPFSKGREIDITKRAFREIATNKTSGGMAVTIDIVE